MSRLRLARLCAWRPSRFCGRNEKEMAVAMIIGKITGGITAAALVAWMTPAQSADQQKHVSAGHAET